MFGRIVCRFLGLVSTPSPDQTKKIKTRNLIHGLLSHIKKGFSFLFLGKIIRKGNSLEKLPCHDGDTSKYRNPYQLHTSSGFEN